MHEGSAKNREQTALGDSAQQASQGGLKFPEGINNLPCRKENTSRSGGRDTQATGNKAALSDRERESPQPSSSIAQGQDRKRVQV
ncbi:hypothetical protein NDU88_009802 [Pleurodeles waltl]|uniref:Uncharacterized protein n=1 Tax=Pleurodeles waltl TaxID=8319 RepID=A0AAV7QWS8_PLEWA|nr:hypothetical protein NDU88_009802 [Pleurodeles waltl]